MTTLTYKHPQGATIEVTDGVISKCVDKNGKAKKTSATPEKLANGHGGWELVSNTDNDIASFFPGLAVPGTSGPVATTTARHVVAPMRFKETEAFKVEAFVNDARYYMQQKVDGVRAVLDFHPDAPPSFRSSTGGALKSSAAAPTVKALLAFFDSTRGDFSVDGEILNGTFHVFDLIHVGQEQTPLMFRVDALRSWYAGINVILTGTQRLSLLPTAITQADKADLVNKVRAAGGEGWIAKRDDSPYDWGSRVDHSLKLKIKNTVDCIVVERNKGGKENFVLGLWDGMDLVEVGNASAIGKPDAQVGDVIEVQYLYTGAGNKLVQPTVLKVRADKSSAACKIDQLVFVNKDVMA